MANVLSLILPLFLLMLLGYCSVRGGLFKRADVKVLADFVMKIALPGLIFHALSQRPAAEIFDMGYIIAYCLGGLAIFGLALLFAKLAKGMTTSRGALYALGMSASNSGFIGFPLAALVLGPPAAIALAMNMIVENLVILPLALALIEGGQGGEKRFHKVLLASLIRLGKNPIIIAIILGCIVSFSGLTMPLFIARAVEMLALAAGATALFVIGGSLVGLNIKGSKRDGAEIALGKLILHPLCVFIAIMLVPGISPEMKTAAILFSAAPMMSIYPLFGIRYNDEAMCTGALMFATFLSFFTLTALLLLLTAYPF